jgi:hypothetical protein
VDAGRGSGCRAGDALVCLGAHTAKLQPHALELVRESGDPLLELLDVLMQSVAHRTTSLGVHSITHPTRDGIRATTDDGSGFSPGQHEDATGARLTPRSLGRGKRRPPTPPFEGSALGWSDDPTDVTTERPLAAGHRC